MNLKIILYILVNGKWVSDMVEENNFGATDQYMKVIGKMIWHMEKED